MSEWEEFCEDLGVNPGCPDDYDRLLEMMETNSWGSRHESAPGFVVEGEPAELRFHTLQEAAEWSRASGGKAFTRSAEGTHFVPKESIRRPPGRPTGAPPHCNLGEGPYLKMAPRKYRGSPEEEERYARELEFAARVFWPRLQKLAPWVAWLAGRRRWRCASMGPGTFEFRLNTQKELDELESLLAERLKRIKNREPTGSAEEAARMNERAARFKRLESRPKEASFWEKALSVVRAEQARRKECSR